MLSIMYENEPNGKFSDNKILDDLNTERLFNKTIRENILYSLKEKEIISRQEFFSQYLTDELFDKCEKVRKLLTELERLKEAYDTAQTKIEVLFTSRYMCNVYYDTIVALLALGEEGYFLKRLHEEAVKLFQDAHEMKEEVDATKDAFITMANWRLSFGGSGLVFMEKGKKTEDGVLSTILSCGKKLEIVDQTFATDVNLRVPSEISDILFDLYPQEAKKLTIFVSKYKRLINYDVLNLKSELNFYSSLRNIYKKAEAKGITSTYGNITNERKYSASSVYDISLLFNEDTVIVPNDVDFSGKDTICFLTGANGGGKTTYLRAVALNLILFLAGMPVFAEKFEAFRFEKVACHFPVNETFNDKGRLAEECERAENILQEADNKTFIFFNETFSGTDSDKGATLALDAAEKARQKGAFMLFVTHFFEVSKSDFTMLHTRVSEGNGNQRTFIIEKGEGKKRSYASDILDKYGLSYKKLKERFGEDYEA